MQKNPIEIADGVFERRQLLLWLPLFALGGTVPAAQPVRADERGGRMPWPAFLETALPAAAGLHSDPSAAGQDAYLFGLASLAMRLDAVSMPKARLVPFADLSPPVETGPAYFGKPFFIIEWRMAANAVLPPHDHPNISVCTVCVAGEARLRNFEPGEESGKFLVRETHDEILSPGRVNTLSSHRDNIHTLRAGRQGARGFDITTYHGPDAGFSFIDIAAKPRDAERRVYEASRRKKK
jgi:hypothetical protein